MLFALKQSGETPQAAGEGLDIPPAQSLENGPQNANAGANARLTESDVAEYLAVGKNKSIRDAKAAAQERGENVVLVTPGETKTFIGDAIRGAGGQITKAYGKVGTEMAEDIRSVSGTDIDVAGWYLELVPDELKHSFDEHAEAKRDGNINLTEQDYLNIPDYIDSYDDILEFRTFKSGDKEVIIGKKINGYSVIVELLSTKRRSLHFKNMWGLDTRTYESRYGKSTASHPDRSSVSDDANDPTEVYHGASSDVSIPQTAQSVNPEAQLTGETVRLTSGAEVPVYSSIPEGWGVTHDATTAPRGYVLIDNRRSHFSGERQIAVVPDRPATAETGGESGSRGDALPTAGEAQKTPGLQSETEASTIEKTAPVRLDEEEEHAVLAYKSGESYKLNAAVRDGGKLTQDQQQMVERLDRALPRLPAYQGQVYRRIGFDSIGGRTALDAFLEEHKPGSFVQYPAFTSSSVDVDGYPVDGDLTVTMVIQSESGRDLAGHGNNSEREIVFPRDSEFFVERVEISADGKPVIYMKEVAIDGAGQLHSEEQHGRVQPMPEVPQGDSHLREVSEAHIQGKASGDVPGLRGEGTPGVGAAEAGFQVPGGPSQEVRTSRYANSMGYNADQAEATGLDRESYEARFRYRVESEAESSQRAYEMLFYRQGAEGEEVFIKDLDPAGYEEITAYLENAPAWGPVEMDTARQRC